MGGERNTKKGLEEEEEEEVRGEKRRGGDGWLGGYHMHRRRVRGGEEIKRDRSRWGRMVG